MPQLTELELTKPIENHENYTVYIHVNKINGKKYVGITRQNAQARWQRGKAYKNNAYFCNAIKKYGWNNFKHIIIATGLAAKEAEKLEQKLIAEYQSNSRTYGYNITSGGEIGKKYSDETKKKISVAIKGKYKGENNPMYGKRHTEQTKKKISLSNKGKTPSEEARKKMSLANKGKNNSMYGKKHSEATKKKIGLSRKGRNTGENHPKARKIICLNNGLVFNTIFEAAQKYNISNRGTHIGGCCRGQRKSCGKDPQTGIPLRWAYVEDKESVKK